MHAGMLHMELISYIPELEAVQGQWVETGCEEQAIDRPCCGCNGMNGNTVSTVLTVATPNKQEYQHTRPSNQWPMVAPGQLQLLSMLLHLWDAPCNGLPEVSFLLPNQQELASCIALELTLRSLAACSRLLSLHQLHLPGIDLQAILQTGPVLTVGVIPAPAGRALAELVGCEAQTVCEHPGAVPCDSAQGHWRLQADKSASARPRRDVVQHELVFPGQALHHQAPQQEPCLRLGIFRIQRAGQRVV